MFTWRDRQKKCLHKGQTKKVFTKGTEGHNMEIMLSSLINVFSYSFFNTFFWFKTTPYNKRDFMQNLKEIGQLVSEKNMNINSDIQILLYR